MYNLYLIYDVTQEFLVSYFCQIKYLRISDYIEIFIIINVIKNLPWRVWCEWSVQSFQMLWQTPIWNAWQPQQTLLLQPRHILLNYNVKLIFETSRYITLVLIVVLLSAIKNFHLFLNNLYKAKKKKKWKANI